jgi:hypothetical protein
MLRTMAQRTLALLGAVTAAGCSRGSGSVAPGPDPGGEFFVLATDPPAEAQIYLNDSVFVTFTRDVDLATADLNALNFTVFDANGVALQEQPRGTFAVRSALGGAAGNRRVLEFRPTFPTDDDYRNGGWRAGRRYLLQIAQGDRRRNTVLKDTSGRSLDAPFTLAFRTVAGETPSQLFRDAAVGGPRFVAARVTPSTDGVVHSGKKGVRPVEVRVTFDQPLNPTSANVPVRIDVSPARVDPHAIEPAARGRVFLEYDDPQFGPSIWIPALAAFEQNDNTGATLVLTPTGVLPNDALVRVIVEPTLEDLSGESNRNDASHVRAVASFRTEAARAPQFDALVETFTSAEHVDLDAPFLEPLAELGDGFLRAAWSFEGTETQFDYRPNTREVVLNTDFTQISPTNGAPFNVSGGVFQFRNVTIPAGVSVRGVGSKPMVWLVTGDFIVEGEITVAGGAGARVDTLFSANFPTAGGVGVCGGGNGGRGSPSTNSVDQQGEAGYGADQTPGAGGLGGWHTCRVSRTSVGGGGGGGSFSTFGDPYYYLGFTPGPTPAVMLGRGGRMGIGSTATGPQVEAGPLTFRDARVDNDFYGTLIDLAQSPPRRITGELLVARGGAGGGGGGDTGPLCDNPANFILDRKGGGGGAGGGVLIVKALRRIVIKSSGSLNASGGNGGGGEEAGTNSVAGGGGGGSGGMVVLMTGSGIHIAAHGRTYADGTINSNVNGAYTFAVQADGGIGTSAGTVVGKYPGDGAPTVPSQWERSLGGFGGLGLVQLMAPPGDNRDDGTNTVLDDRIYFYRDDAALGRGLDSRNPHLDGAMTGADKIAYLGWRGFARETGERRDDAGNPVRLPRNNQGGEGDIRPSPVLLPSPIGPLSRMRSPWLDTGATARLADGAATRGIDERRDASDPDNPLTNLTAGPTYLFAGTFSGDSEPQGYVAYRQSAGGAERAVTDVLPRPVAVESVGDGQWEGAAVYVVRLREASAVLGLIPGRLTGYRARLLSAAGSTLGAYRIVAHDAQTLQLGVEAGPLPSEAMATLQVAADFVGYATSDADDLGPTVIENGRAVPKVNARVGFAFHANPARPRMLSPDHDADRYPHRPGTFLYALDLARPEHLRAIRALGKDLALGRGATAVQWDVLFNTAFSAAAAGNVDATRVPEPGAPLPELRYLVIPYQY